MKSALALALLGGALCSAGAPEGPRQQPEPQAAAPAARTPGAPPRSAAPHAVASVPPAPHASLAQAYQHSGNLLAFIEQARREPQRGGVFYAAVAIAECSLAGATTETPDREPAGPSHADLQRRAVLLDRAQRRCEPLAALDDASRRAVLADGRGRDDPLLSAWRGWRRALEAGDLGRMCDTVATAYALRDPLLMAQIAASGSSYWREPGAWLQLPCTLGLDCQPDNPTHADAAAGCAVRGECTADPAADPAAGPSAAQALAAALGRRDCRSVW